MPSPASVKLRSNTIGADHVFAAEELPLISRRISSQHLDDQGPSLRRIDVTLNGFHLGDNLKEVITKHKALIATLKSNEVKLTYTDGVNTIYDGMAWVDDYNEPSEWKQYKGNYQISLHYFEASDQNNTDLVIVASFVSAAGVFTFAPPLTPPPLFGFSAKKSRSSWRASDISPTGVPITREAEISLEGFFVASDHTTLMGVRQALITAISLPGTLNYGAFSAYGSMTAIQFPSVFPRQKCYYTLQFHYDVGFGIRALKTTRSVPRIHNNPMIRDRPQCGLPPDVTELGQSGQLIRYGFFIQGDDMVSMRALLASEASYAIVPGGYEMEGGSQEEDDETMSINLAVLKFYPTPVVPNLAGT